MHWRFFLRPCGSRRKTAMKLCGCEVGEKDSKDVINKLLAARMLHKSAGLLWSSLISSRWSFSRFLQSSLAWFHTWETNKSTAMRPWMKTDSWTTVSSNPSKMTTQYPQWPAQESCLLGSWLTGSQTTTSGNNSGSHAMIPIITTPKWLDLNANWQFPYYLSDFPFTTKQGKPNVTST